MKNEKFVTAYKNARSSVEDIIGVIPEDYKVLLFVDPQLYDSVLLQTEKAGTPKAVISANELYVLQEMQNENYTPSGKDLFFASRTPRMFYPGTITELPQKAIEAKLVDAFAKAALAEETKSRFPDKLKQLYRKDNIIYELFANNVYEFVMERGAPWVWQYFQDFTAVMRLLSLYDLDDFYVPPTSIRSASVFYNYLLEIKGIIKERSKDVLSTPLFDLLNAGIGNIALNEYLDNIDENVRSELEPHLKSNLGQPMGVIGGHFLKQYGDSPSEIFEATREFNDDQELTSLWNRGETKRDLEQVREDLSNRAIVFHSAVNSYWSDLWPMRGSAFDKVGQYVGKIQRRGYRKFSELQEDSPLVTSHGRVQLSDREVVVLGIQEDTVGQEQLVILRNHLQAKKDTFSTPLPGLPDTIVFKKMSGMHVASYLGVGDLKKEQRYPKSPYDLPLTVRAIQVTSREGAYRSQEREDEGKLDFADYEDLYGLTEPQYRAIRYLIRQGDVEQ